MGQNLILIIDDDPVTSAIVEEYLVNYGLKVLMAKNGDEGLDLMKKSPPDLILLDIMMSGKDGIQILKEIKLTPGFTRIPILLWSSVDRTNIKIKGLKLGADDYITKPVDKAELLARIQLSIKRSQNNKEDPGILNGNLSDFSLADLLQSFELGRKTATLTFPDIDGEIVIEEGMIIHCRQGNFTQTKAINRIFFLEKGKFLVNFNKIDKNIKKSKIGIMNLLMSNIAYIDEVRLMMKSIPNSEGAVEITEEFKELTGLETSESEKKMRIIEIILKMKGSLKENVESLILINKNFPHLFNTEK